MSLILDQLRLWVEAVIMAVGYPGISLLMLVENLFPPIPSEVVMPFAGFLVSDGKMVFWIALIAGTVGSLAGAVVIYGVARGAGERRVLSWVNKYGKYFLITEEDFTKVRDGFLRHGRAYIMAGHLIPGVRSLISLPAGLGKMNFGLFVLYTVIGATVWNTFLLAAGVFLGSRWEQVLTFVKTYELLIWASLAILGIIFVVRRLFFGGRTRKIIGR